MATHDPYAAQLQEAARLIQEDEREQALAILYGVVTGAPLHRDAWYLIAQAAANTRQREQALRRALEIAPSFEPARRMLARLSQMNVPTERGSTARPPSAAEYARPFEQARDPFSAEPGLPPSRQVEPPPRPPEREREVVYVERAHLQPMLILNGGCASGCFALVLTLAALLVLAFLLTGDAVSRALRDVGSLAADQSVGANLIPALAITAVLALLQNNPGLIPINLGVLGATGTGAEVFSNGLRSFWASMGYPATTGDVILGRLGGVGSQIGTLGGLLPLIFLGGWVILAFLFVFLRARGGRFLHWFLSTVGLGILAGLALGLGTLLFRRVGG